MKYYVMQNGSTVSSHNSAEEAMAEIKRLESAGGSGFSISIAP